MDRKSTKSDSKDPATPPLSDAIKASAQQIWLAGLGAFAKAQEEGGKVFEALVKEGLTIQRKTQAAAEEKLAEATSHVADVATDLGARATGHWDKLENSLEDRVARALHGLGVPSSQDIETLSARIDALQQRVERLSRHAAPGKTTNRHTTATAERRTASTGQHATRRAKPPST